MAKKDKRRSGQSQPLPASDTAPADAGTSETAEQRRARQVKEWEERKRRKELRGKIRVPLIGTTTVGALVGGATSVIVVVGAIAGVFLLLTGGGDGGGGSAASPTPDPRVAGLPIAQTVELDATDSGVNVNPIFDPAVITGSAGDVIEIRVTNTGSSAHNLSVAGVDEEFGSRDDFAMDSIEPGEEGILLVKLDESGTYPFRCDLHPIQQTGTLILS